MGTILSQDQKQEIIIGVLSQLAKAQPLGDLRLETLFDTKNNRFQVMVLGWLDGKPLHDCLAYVTIRNEQIWLEIDNTDFGLTDALIRAGIPEDTLMFGLPMPQSQLLVARAA